MIVKELGYNGSFGILYDYLNRDADLTFEDSFTLFHNLGSATNRNAVLARFIQNDSLRSRVRTRARHIVLSFSPKDSEAITPQVLFSLCQRFIKLRAPEALFYGRAHYDKEHLHVHLMCSNNVLGLDKSISTSLSQFMQIRKDLEVYQREMHPQLEHSFAYTKEHTRELQPFKKTAQPSLKNEAISLLEELANQAQSMDDFYQLIEQHPDAELYSAHNKINGIIFKQQKKFRFKRAIPDRYAALERIQRIHQELHQNLSNGHDLTDSFSL